MNSNRLACLEHEQDDENWAGLEGARETAGGGWRLQTENWPTMKTGADTIYAWVCATRFAGFGRLIYERSNAEIGSTVGFPSESSAYRIPAVS